MDKDWVTFFYPSLKKILILLVLITVATLVKTHVDATSKVSWNVERGIPFTYLDTTLYKGPCPTKPYCETETIEALYFIPLITNIAVWYVISCIVSLLFERLRG